MVNRKKTSCYSSGHVECLLHCCGENITCHLRLKQTMVGNGWQAGSCYPCWKTRYYFLVSAGSRFSCLTTASTNTNTILSQYNIQLTNRMSSNKEVIILQFVGTCISCRLRSSPSPLRVYHFWRRTAFKSPGCTSEIKSFVNFIDPGMVYHDPLVSALGFR